MYFDIVLHSTFIPMNLKCFKLVIVLQCCGPRALAWTWVQSAVHLTQSEVHKVFSGEIAFVFFCTGKNLTSVAKYRGLTNLLSSDSQAKDILWDVRCSFRLHKTHSKTRKSLYIRLRNCGVDRFPIRYKIISSPLFPCISLPLVPNALNILHHYASYFATNLWILLIWNMTWTAF